MIEKKTQNRLSRTSKYLSQRQLRIPALPGQEGATGFAAGPGIDALYVVSSNKAKDDGGDEASREDTASLDWTPLHL